MPEELQKIILHKYNEAFKKQLEKNEELIKLFWGMCNYYGVVDIEVFNDRLSIGIISHVESIKNRVPVKLIVTAAE